MDIFGDDSDGGNEDNDELNRETAYSSQTLSHFAFIETMKLKPFLKRSSVSSVNSINSTADFILKRHIAICFDGCDKKTIESKEILKNRLSAAKFDHVDEVCAESLESLDRAVPIRMYDAVIMLRNNDCETISKNVVDWLDSSLSSGSILFISIPVDVVSSIFTSNTWKIVIVNDVSCGVIKNIMLRKQTVTTNPKGALYWANSPEAIINETRVLDTVIVNLSVSERQLGIFSTATHKRAVDCLRQHGLCILPGLVNTHQVLERGEKSKKDLFDALVKLKSRGLDLLRPLEPGQRIDNFHELSMREALRCDLRNGVHMTAADSCDALRFQSGDPSISPSIVSASSSIPNTTSGIIGNQRDSPERNLRHHPAIEQVLLEVMNPPGGEAARGNWGRWNFDGPGPDAGPPPLTVGKLATVISMPGCADQTIHADTAHIYVHTQLPGHYYNLFMPAVSGEAQASLEVGQTAFVVGSHELETSARIMVQEGGQEELERRLVRPHLQAGDALLFDCRILHFGLANQRPQPPPLSSPPLPLPLPSPITDSATVPSDTCVVPDETTSSWQLSPASCAVEDVRASPGLDSHSHSESHSHSHSQSYSRSGDCDSVNRSLNPERDAHEVPSNPLQPLGPGVCGSDAVPAEWLDEVVMSRQRWRPMLYVNYHQPWFVDPKNWNDKERLFT